MCVMVWNSDRLGRNDFLGEVSITFDHHSFDDASPKFYKLQDRVSQIIYRVYIEI